MKRYLSNIWCLIFLMAAFQSCIKDNGNYKYNFGNEVQVRYATYNYTTFLEDSISIFPLRTFLNPEKDSSDYEHSWLINGKVYSEKPTLRFASSVNGSYSVMYYMKDKESGINFPALSSFTINVTSPYQTGWGILYEKNNESELAHVRITGGQYFPYTDLYKTFNNGESLGSQPVRLKDYAVSGGRGLMVLQNGGQGPVDLDAYNFKKQIVVKDAFTSGVPANFRPVDLAFYANCSVLINEDGKIYTRAWKGSALAYMIPWITTPYYILGDVKIKNIWEVMSNTTYLGFMYDELNKRVLKTETYANNANNLGIPIMPLNMPAAGYPEGYAPIQNLGESEYIWGGTYLDVSSLNHAMVLLRDPADHKTYVQTFTYDFMNAANILLPKVRALVEDGGTITPNSKFATLKGRNYLAYTNGTDNRSIYTYDLQSGTPVKKYIDLPSPATVIRASDDGQTIAVGLENGTFLIYNMSDNLLNTGSTEELYKLEGLGKVVDVTIKSGRNS